MKKSIVLGISLLACASIAKAQRPIFPPPPWECNPGTPYWNLGGNNFTGQSYVNVFDANIGTCDYADFVLKSNNINSLWVKTDGKVSVGSSYAPSQFNVNTSGTNDGIRVLQSGNTAAVLQLFHTQNGAGKWGLMCWGPAQTGPDFSIFDYNIASGGHALFINGSNGVYDPMDGNVGIATPYPNRKFCVDGDVSFATGYTSGMGYGPNGIEILMGAKVPTRRGISTDGDPNGNFDFFINNYQSANGLPKFRFKNGIAGNGLPAGTSTAAPDLMTIDGNGKVVINDYYSQQDADAFLVNDAIANKTNFKVKKNGVVYAREINVLPTTTLFPDYVFEENYKLLSLEELAAYLKTNKHLPNIPSATEVSTNGMNMADLQVRQMEKIEEAVLYILELKKENEELKKRIEKLEQSK